MALGKESQEVFTSRLSTVIDFYCQTRAEKPSLVKQPGYQAYKGLPCISNVVAAPENAKGIDYQTQLTPDLEKKSFESFYFIPPLATELEKSQSWLSMF